MQRKSLLITAILILILAFGVNAIAWAQEASPAGAVASDSSAFTYQGQIKDASGPMTGSCDFKFSLWETLNGNEQIGSTLTQTGVPVNEGLFTAQLDFGSNAFPGNARWLEIAVRCPTGTGTYSTLSPRQPVTAAPYAMHADEANFAWNALSADRLDGLDSSAFQQHYQNLVVVAKSGGDFTTITEALNSITTNRVDNSFTIYVAPGVYTETITMKPFVDIEGAGEQATKITYTGSSDATTATVAGSSYTEIRFLTVENTGGDASAVAIRNSSTSLRMTHLTIKAAGGTGFNFGVYNAYSSPVMVNITVSTSGGTDSYIYGVYNASGSPSMQDVKIIASGGAYTNGISNASSSPSMTNVTITASGGTQDNIGVDNYSSSPTMTGVTATGLGGVRAIGLRNDASSPTMNNIIASASGGTDNYGVYNISYSSPMMRDITATASGGTHNTGVHNETYSAPTMINVTAMASGGTYNYGVRNIDSSPTMMNVVANASGGTWQNAGVFNTSSAPVMTNVTATASGGSTSMAVDNYLSSPVMTNVTAIASSGTYATYGVWNDSSSPTIHNCSISASGGTSDGLHNIASSGTYTIQINNSQITGGSSTIYQDSHYTTRVGASMLAGGGAFGGTYVCVVSYNGNFTALNSTCQP